ncbi:MAG: hypothetical protein ACKOCJ_08125 [Burkholderiaceae bacterium]
MTAQTAHPTAEPPPRGVRLPEFTSALGLEPNDVIAVARRFLALIGAMLLLVLGTSVFTPAIYANVAFTQWYAVVAMGIVGFALWLTGRGRPVVAFLMFLVFQWIVLGFMCVFAAKPTVYGMSALALVPLATIVVGFRFAMIFGVSFVALCAMTLLVRAIGSSMPVLFLVPPAVEGLVLVLALVSVAFPLPLLLRTVRTAFARSAVIPRKLKQRKRKP